MDSPVAKEESAADLALIILPSSYSSRTFGRSGRLVGIVFVRVEPRIKPAFVSNMSKSLPPGLLMPLVLTVQIPLFPECNFVAKKTSVCWVP